METKKRWQSKTIIAQIIAVICLGLTMTGKININESVQGEVVDGIFSLGLVISQLYAIYGRIVADTKIE